MFIVEANFINNFKLLESLLEEISVNIELNLLLFNHDQINIHIDENKLVSGDLSFDNLSLLFNYLQKMNIEVFTIIVNYDNIFDALNLVKKIEDKYKEDLLSVRINCIIQKTIYERKIFDD